VILNRSSTTLIALFVAACGSSASAGNTPWKGNTANIVNSDGTVLESTAGSCVKLASGECVDTSAECGAGSSADVFLGADGEVASVVCYPKEGVTGTLDGATSLPADAKNNEFLVLEGNGNDPAFVGNLELSGNNNTLYGEDPAEAVLDGNLLVSTNNVLVSGITITGNVEVPANESRLSRCVIEGDLVITGNNTIVAGCRVMGNIIVKGNNTELTANRVDGSIEIKEASGTDCVDNYRGESLESGEVLSCGGK
jgi:hypothetical protein